MFIDYLTDPASMICKATLHIAYLTDPTSRKNEEVDDGDDNTEELVSIIPQYFHYRE